MSLCLCGCGETTGIADRTDPRHGWVKGQHKRYLRAKVSPAIVHTIRTSSLSARALGAELGISHTTISDIRSGKRWSNVQ